MEIKYINSTPTVPFSMLGASKTKKRPDNALPSASQTHLNISHD